MTLQQACNLLVNEAPNKKKASCTPTKATAKPKAESSEKVIKPNMKKSNKAKPAKSEIKPNKAKPAKEEIKPEKGCQGSEAVRKAAYKLAAAKVKTKEDRINLHKMHGCGKCRYKAGCTASCWKSRNMPVPA